MAQEHIATDLVAHLALLVIVVLRRNIDAVRRVLVEVSKELARVVMVELTEVATLLLFVLDARLLSNGSDSSLEHKFNVLGRRELGREALQTVHSEHEVIIEVLLPLCAKTETVLKYALVVLFDFNVKESAANLQHVCRVGLQYLRRLYQGECSKFRLVISQEVIALS